MIRTVAFIVAAILYLICARFDNGVWILCSISSSQSNGEV
jgi:hypothetical protein